MINRWLEQIIAVEARINQLNSWEQNFIKSIRRQFNTHGISLTDKQALVLARMCKQAGYSVLGKNYSKPKKHSFKKKFRQEKEFRDASVEKYYSTSVRKTDNDKPRYNI